jgi:AcrR family transcriptional regulator
MRACLELLAEGKVELPVAEVAERSGVTRGTVYRWWPTPTELLNEALAFHARHRTDAPDTGSWETDIRVFVTQLADLAVDPVERGIMATMISGRYPAVNESLMNVYRRDLPQWFAMIGRAVGRGEIHPDIDPAILLHMMLSPAVSVSLFEGRALTKKEIESLVTLVCRATANQSVTPERDSPRSSRRIADKPANRTKSSVKRPSTTKKAAANKS